MKKANIIFLALLLFCMLNTNMNAQNTDLQQDYTGSSSNFVPSPLTPTISCLGEETSIDTSPAQTTQGIISTAFTPPGNPANDTESADDFVLTDTRVLSGVSFFGFSNEGGGPYDSITVRIYADDQGSPKDEAIYEESFSSDASGAAIGDMFQLYIPVSVRLSAGTYWISAQIQDDTRWNWFASNTAAGPATAHLRNVGGGFGVGTDWVAFNNIGVTFTDLSFTLDFCPPLVAVPTMSQWGLFLFSLVSLTLGMVFMYRMETEKAVAGMSMSANTSSSLPFNMEVFQASMKHALGLAVVGFALILFGWGEIVSMDLVGMMIAIPIVAYMIHIAKMMKK